MIIYLKVLPRKHSLQNKDHIFDEVQYNFYLRKYRDLYTSENLTKYYLSGYKLITLLQ